MAEYYFPPNILNSLPNTDARTQSIAPYQSNSIAIAGYAPYGSGNAPGASLFVFNTQTQVWSDLRVDLGFISDCFQQVEATNYSQSGGYVQPSNNGIIAAGINGAILNYSPAGVLTAKLISEELSFAYNNSLSAAQVGGAVVNLVGTKSGQLYNSLTGSLYSALPASSDVYSCLSNGGSPNFSASLNAALGKSSGATAELNTNTLSSGTSGSPGVVLALQIPKYGSNGALVCAQQVTAYQNISLTNNVNNDVSVNHNGFCALGSVQAAIPFFNCVSQNPENPNIIIGISSLSTASELLTASASIYSVSGSNNWQLSSNFVLEGVGTGLSAAYKLNCCWSTNGTQAFISDPGLGNIILLNYSLGNLTISQTQNVAGLGDICIGSDGSLLAVNNLGLYVSQQNPGEFTWSFGVQQITIESASCVASNSISGLSAVCGAGAVYILGVNDGVWSVTQIVPIGFNPTSMTIDNFGNIIVATAGSFSIINGGVVSSGSFSGESAVSMLAYQYQVIISDYIGNSLYIIGPSDGENWTQQNSISLNQPCGNLSQAGETIFLSYGNTTASGGWTSSSQNQVGTLLYNWGAPWRILPVRQGVMTDLINLEGFLDFGIDNIPTGNYTRSSYIGSGQTRTYVPCSNNNFFVIDTGSSAGEFSVLHEMTIPNQVGGGGIPLGPSSVYVSPFQNSDGSDQVYVGFAMCGGLCSFEVL